MKESIIKTIRKIVPQRVRQSKIAPLVSIWSILFVFLLLILSTMGDTERWISLNFIAR